MTAVQTRWTVQSGIAAMAKRLHFHVAIGISKYAHSILLVLLVPLLLYVGSYYAMFNPDAVTFSKGVSAPLATYRVPLLGGHPPMPSMCNRIFRPMDLIDMQLRPSRYEHQAAGLQHFVEMGKLRDEWWQRE